MHVVRTDIYTSPSERQKQWIRQIALPKFEAPYATFLIFI